jgi:hypothetical protein
MASSGFAQALYYWAILVPILKLYHTELVYNLHGTLINATVVHKFGGEA